MESHKEVSLDEGFRPKTSDSPEEFFRKAVEFTEKNYPEVLKRIGEASVEKVDKKTFFREYIWSVHTSGFSAKAVSKFFGPLEDAYGDPDVLAKEKYEDVVERVSKVCNNSEKIRAVMRTSILMKDWGKFKETYLNSIDAIEKIPYIGPKTKFHVGRNIGFKDAVKPDLHLERLRLYWGFKNSESLCIHMKEKSGTQYPLGLVDLCVWYLSSSYGTSEFERKQ